MAGHAKTAGPTSARVATNVKRLRQERGLSYAELARRLAALGHPILDTGLMKIEKGERRVDVDDLVALAVALGTTPNRLLLPGTDVTEGATDHVLVPGIRGPRRGLWAWASGEVPLGHKSASAETSPELRSEEVTFTHENRPHHWNVFVNDKEVPTLLAGIQRATAGQVEHGDTVTGLIALVVEAFRENVTTAGIRTVVEAGLTGALLAPDEMDLSVTATRNDGSLFIEIQEARADGSEGRQS